MSKMCRMFGKYHVSIKYQSNFVVLKTCKKDMVGAFETELGT